MIAEKLSSEMPESAVRDTVNRMRAMTSDDLKCSLEELYQTACPPQPVFNSAQDFGEAIDSVYQRVIDDSETEERLTLQIEGLRQQIEETDA